MQYQHTQWAPFRSEFAKTWRQGQHISIIGSTGTGKSVLECEILSMRRFVILLATKGEDPELADFTRTKGFRRIAKWEPHKGKPSEVDNRIALWPRVDNLTDFKRLGRVFYDAINGYEESDTRRWYEFWRLSSVPGIYKQGRWTLGLDEVSVLAHHLNLGETLSFLWTQARTKLISLVGGTQRPRWVPREMFTEPHHLFLFNLSDKEDIARLGEIGGRRVNEIKAIVPELPPYHFLYVNKRSGDMSISKVER